MIRSELTLEQELQLVQKTVSLEEVNRIYYKILKLVEIYENKINIRFPRTV